MSRRSEQLASAIDLAVRQILSRGLQDPRISGLITVTSVRVIDDLSEAHIGISVLPEEKEPLTLHGLQSAAAHIRREVGKLVETRQIPPLRFRADKSTKKQAALLKDLDLAKADLERRAAESPDREEPKA
ncbi:Ribosome-binding factor A [Phycisphaerales bacterium]|nr:Ribosome-binding factor A [Phycisphaerales bacterium]